MMSYHAESMDDATLVARAREGEHPAFDALARRYYASVLRLCGRLLGATFEAQDVAQEAVLQAFLHLPRLQEPARFGAWLHAIAANLCRMALRRHRTLSLQELDENAMRLVHWPVLPTPEEVAAARETHDTIIAALGQLSVVNREVVIRFYLEGYSYDELSVLLGVPVSTVKGRLFKGRRQLRTSLAPLAREVPMLGHQTQKEQKMNGDAQVRVSIDSVRTQADKENRIVVLREETTQRIMLIYVGLFEGQAIASAIEGEQRQRPMTHDLTMRLLEGLNAQVQQVVVNKLLDSTFYAEVTLVQGEQSFTVDARPSDAFALAARCGAPILVARAVFDQAGGEDNEVFWNKEAELVQERRSKMEQRLANEEANE